MYCIELGDYLSPDGVSCRMSSWTRQEDRSLPLRGKISGAYITSSLAKTEASLSGFDEALLLNSSGKVSEASGMNLFIVRNGDLITPGVDQDILEGITRASVIELAKSFGINVIERPVDKTELLLADEVFLTGTAAKITPVMITGMFLFFPLPAGVLLYMVVANIFQAFQTFLLNKEALPENLQKILDQQLSAKNEVITTSASTISDKRLPFEPNSKK